MAGLRQKRVLPTETHFKNRTLNVKDITGLNIPFDYNPLVVQGGGQILLDRHV